MKKALVIIINLLYVLTYSIGQSNSSNLDSLQIKLDHNIPLWINEYKVPGVSVAVIEEGRIKWTKAYGGLEKGHPAPNNALFNTASIGKSVTATMVLKLVDAKQWSLDEPLAKYWVDPEIKDNPWHKKVTTRHVLGHRTGFKNWRHYSADKKLSFDFEPGTAHQYSGEGMEYLQKALENKFNKSFDQLIDSLIFKPLQMNNSQYWTDTLDLSRFAYSHDVKGDKYQGLTYNYKVTAAGNIITTAEDLAKFGAHVINGAGISSSLYNDMITHQGNEKTDSGFGLGWNVIKNLPNGEYALKHGGDDVGVHSVIVLLPKSKRGIVVFTNGDNGMLIVDKVTKELVNLSPPLNNPVAITLENSKLDLYTGKFLQNDGRMLLLERVGNTLKMSGEGIPLIELTPETETRFFVKDYPINLEFIKNPTDNSMKMMIYEKGKLVMEAGRVKS